MDGCSPNVPHPHHIDVQLSAIQELCEQANIPMKYPLDTLNMTDDSTKAFEWIPHDQYVQHIMSYHQSLSLLRMRNIVEFQVALKLELGEGVVAHACSLRVLYATDYEFQIVLKLELGECVAAHACSLHVLYATNPSMFSYHG